MQERLHKFIAHAGVSSRREAERFIAEGRVAVNDRIVTKMGTKVDPIRDTVKLDGRLIRSSPGKLYVVLNKPVGYVSTLKDPQGRPVIMELLDRIPSRVYPVGRLDYDAEGLVLLTNDGELSHRLQHPRYGIRRIYEVKVKGVPTGDELSRVRNGIKLEDGVTLPANVMFLRRTVNNCWMKITLSEGRNRQVKRMFAAIGHPVMKLKRVKFGVIGLGNLMRGQYRQLTRDEVQALYNLVSL